MENIIETLQNKLEYNFFLKAIFLTNYFEILRGKGPFTVLAPKDTAFENLRDQDREKILSDVKKAETMVSQHISIGHYTTWDLTKMDELPTMENTTLAIEKHNEGLIIGGGKVVEKDIVCENGIIQGLDAVLLP